MELFGLGASYGIVKPLKCINIQWDRRYYAAGQFALQLRADDWDTSIAYIYTATRPEMGMVEKVESEHAVKGDFVNVSGYFLEGMLNWKVTYPQKKAKNNVAAICKALVTTHMVDTGVTVPVQTNLGVSTSLDSLGEFVGDVTYAALKEQELSQRIRFDYATNALLYEVWQGVDRSQAQNVNAYAVFSQDFGTVDALTLTQDGSAMRNFAQVIYDGGTRTIDLRTGTEPKRVLYVDTGMAQEEGETLADFLEAVDAEATKALKEYAHINNIDATVLQNNLVYLTDYDLGDKCEVRNDRLKLAFTTRIIEVNEVWKKGEHTVSLQFGDKIPAAYERGRA